MLGKNNVSTTDEVSSGAAVVSDEATIIYTYLIYSSLCQMINIFGIITNIINIICFINEGFKDSVNITLLGLSVSDLGSLIMVFLSCIALTPAVVASDIPFDSMEVGYITTGIPHFCFTRVSSCITAMITLERCLCITAPLKVKSIVTPFRTTVATICVFIIFFSSGTPFYVVNKLDMKFSPKRNQTIFGILFTHEREQVEKITVIINNFAIPLGAFVMIVVCTAILSYKLRVTAKWRETTTTAVQVDRVSSRHQKVAKMVLMISTLFIVCFTPLSIIMISMAFIPEFSISGKYMNVTLLISGGCFIMESINSSMNIFIYYHMSSKYRDNFNYLFCRNKLGDQPVY